MSVNSSILPVHIVNDIFSLRKKTYECSICLETIAKKDVNITTCGHFFHKDCLETALRVKYECPVCRKNLQGFSLDASTSAATIRQLTRAVYARDEEVNMRLEENQILQEENQILQEKNQILQEGNQLLQDMNKDLEYQVRSLKDKVEYRNERNEILKRRIKNNEDKEKTKIYIDIDLFLTILAVGILLIGARFMTI